MKVQPLRPPPNEGKGANSTKVNGTGCSSLHSQVAGWRCCAGKNSEVNVVIHQCCILFILMISGGPKGWTDQPLKAYPSNIPSLYAPEYHLYDAGTRIPLKYGIWDWHQEQIDPSHWVKAIMGSSSHPAISNTTPTGLIIMMKNNSKHWYKSKITRHK